MSILLAMPLAWLDFDVAFLVWNFLSFDAILVSLWIIRRTLGIEFSARRIAPTIALLLLCNPLRQQMIQGQLNAVLLLLLTLMWVSERSGRPRCAGLMLGLAAGIKLFPALFFFYYALRRRWGVVVAGMTSFAILAGISSIVFGPDIHRVYVREVLPQMEWFRAGWSNASILGFWSKLFDPAPEKGRSVFVTLPYYQSALIAHAGALVSSAVILTLTALGVRASDKAGNADRAFGLVLTALLLVSPIAWEHYFLLLFPAQIIVWNSPMPAPVRRAVVVLTALLFADPSWFWDPFISWGEIAGSFHAITVFSIQFYALLCLFLLQLWTATASAAHDHPERQPADSY